MTVWPAAKVDAPHGCAWRTSLESVGQFELVGFVRPAPAPPRLS